jgi:hypothetical protein
MQRRRLTLKSDRWARHDKDGHQVDVDMTLTYNAKKEDYETTRQFRSYVVCAKAAYTVVKS